MNARLALRVVGTLAMALVGWQVGSLLGEGSSQPRNALLGIAIGALIGLILAPFILARPYHALRRHIGAMPPADLLYAIVGLILGLIVAALIAYPLSFLPWWFGRVLPAVATVVCAYIGVSFMMMRRRELTRFLQARFGGHQNRKGDGLPGWQTIWKGWMKLHTALEFAPALCPSTCVQT